MHLCRIRQRKRHHAQHHGKRVALLIRVAAKPPDAADGKRKIVVSMLQQAIHLAGIQLVDLFDQPLCIVRFEHRVHQTLHFAGNLQTDT
ncbi:hypothetical protein SDC9_138311 [bioreactor metagenome]|uniref:Uncharacterized protein n=1 Tax=bioreactor metagenome TaxID=1076179 RepID=A0A645DNY9_9ZZZZ